MQIDVTPIQGTEYYTVTLAGTYRLLFSGNKAAATEIAQTLRKQINRSGAKAANLGQKKALDTKVVIG